MTTVPIQIPTDFASEEEIELVSWLVDEGFSVEAGDVVAEIATAKAEVEVEAPAAGQIRRSVAAGDLLQPGDVIGAVEHD